MSPAATIAEGILGLEAQMQWNDNPTLINNRNTWPRYWVDRITGLHSNAERSPDSQFRRGVIGEQYRPVVPRGRTVVYEGKVQALDLAGLRAGARTLRAMFNDVSGESGAMTHAPPAGRGGPGWTYYAQVLSLDIDDVQEYSAQSSPSCWQRGFTLSLRQYDPRFFSAAPLTSGAQVSAATYALLNEGTAPASPVFVLTGPLTSPVTIEIVGGRQLVFDHDDMELIIGDQQLEVDFFWRRALSDDHPDVDFGAFLTGTSDWWDDLVLGVDPGSTDVRVTGCLAWAVNWRHADW